MGLSDSDKELLDDIYRFFPTFLMAESLLSLAIRAFVPVGNALDWDQTGKNLTYMAIEGVGYFALVVAIEYALLYKTVISKWWNKNNETVKQLVHDVDYDNADSDVQEEIKRIRAINVEQHTDDEQDKVIISGLHKMYKLPMC